MDAKNFTPAEELAIAEVQAHKEHAARAAENGWHLICQGFTGHRYSTDLHPEQPVLVNGSVLCFATGYEDDGEYELFLGSPYGQRFHAKKVRAMTTGNAKHLRARYSADDLADQLLFLKRTTTDNAWVNTYHNAQYLTENVVTALASQGPVTCNGFCVTAFDAGIEDEETLPVQTIIKAHPSCPEHGTSN